MFDFDLIANDIKIIKEKHIIELKTATNAVPKSFWETYSSFSNVRLYN